jgi:hypothetical protein
METIENISDFLRKIGSTNFLLTGIVIVILWLLISGLRKGLKKRERESKEEGEDNGKKF